MKGTGIIMYKEALRAAWAEINLKNFDYNVKQIRAKIRKESEEFL